MNAFNAVNSGGGDIQLTNAGTALNIENIKQAVGGNIAITNTGAIVLIGRVDTSANVNLTASEAITESGNGKITDAALLTTQSNGGQTLAGANTVNAFNATNVGGDIQLTNTANPLIIENIQQSVGGNVAINNTGAIILAGTVDTADNVDLTASKAITESGNGKVTNAALLTTRSSGGQALNGANTVNAFNAANSGGGDIQLTNTDDALALTGISQTAGGKITISNTGVIEVTGTVDTTDNVDLTASKAITESGNGKVTNAALLTTRSDGGQTLNGANTVDVFNAANNGGGDIQLTNTVNPLIIENVQQGAGGNVTVNNTGDIYVKTVTATAGKINLTASGSILNRLGNAAVNLDAVNINLKAISGRIGEEDTRLRVHATDKVNAAALGDVYLKGCNGDLVSYSMSSQNGVVDLVTDSGDIIINQVNAPRLSFTLTRQGDALNLATINVIDSINVKADNLNFGRMIHTGSTPLHLSIGGGSKDMADNVNINATSGIGIVFDKLHADNGRIDAQTDILDFYNTVVGDRVEFYNKSYSVLADNNYKRLEDFDVQLYPENTPLYLLLESDRLISTNAYIVNYNSDFILNQPDIRNSFVREAKMNLPMMVSPAVTQPANNILTPAFGNGSENFVIYAPSNLGIEDNTGQNGQVINGQDIVTK
jgi:hypothetical protein